MNELLFVTKNNDICISGGEMNVGEVIKHDFIFLLLFPQCEPFVG